MRPPLPSQLLPVIIVFLLASGWPVLPTLQAATPAPDFELPSDSDGLVVNLSGRNLGEFARLTVGMATPTGQPGGTAGRIALRLLNVSGNPRLRVILVEGPLQVMQIDTLDLSGTSVTPTKDLIDFRPPQDVLLSIRQVFINWTAVQESPLDFPAFTELLYRLRAQTFVVNNWPVAQFSANFSQADNACQSKNFDTVSVRSARLVRLADAAVSATQRVDLSFNDISETVGVVFHSASVDLSSNRLSRLASVSFRPGAFCRTQITGLPEVRLNDNALTEAALVEAVVSSPTQPMLLRGLDCSRNPLVVSGLVDSSAKPERRIRVSEWLRLQAVVGSGVTQQNVSGRSATRLSGLLNRLFEPPGDGGPTSLDLSGNLLDSLAEVSRVLTAWTGGGRRLTELRLAGWPVRADHLNLSELEPAVRPTRWLDLGDVGSSGVRSLSVVANGSVEASFDGMKTAWQGEIRLEPLPGVCCHAQGSAGRLLFCFVRPEAGADYRRLICGSGGSVSAATPPQTAPAPALILALAAVAACLAVLLVAVAIVGCVRRRRKRQSTRLRAQPRGSPRRELGTVEVTALRPVES